MFTILAIFIYGNLKSGLFIAGIVSEIFQYVKLKIQYAIRNNIH